MNASNAFGSGGAFVLTPAMMSMDVAGVVAVASNMRHKFPKALVGAYKRYRFGHVDIKLGLVMAATIAAGGFISAPGMMYVPGAPALVASATEPVIAFVMGLGCSVKYAMHGLIEIRLTLILLAESLFGIQLGAMLHGHRRVERTREEQPEAAAE